MTFKDHSRVKRLRLKCYLVNKKLIILFITLISFVLITKSWRQKPIDRKYDIGGKIILTRLVMRSDVMILLLTKRLYILIS